MSLWSEDKQSKELVSVMDDKEGHLGLSDTGRYFLGGIMKHLRPITGIACSTVNSFKR